MHISSLAITLVLIISPYNVERYKREYKFNSMGENGDAHMVAILDIVTVQLH
jgi:hypothetical protein